MPGIDEFTKLLISSNTTDGSVVFADTSGEGHSITVGGDVHHEADQAKFGTTSIHFDGGGDYLSIPASSDWSFGTDDFTIDLWFYKARSGVFEILCSNFEQDTPVGFLIAASDDDSTTFWVETDTGGVGLGSPPVRLLVGWNHVAIVRNGDDLIFYHNGRERDRADIAGQSLLVSPDDLTLGRLGEADSDYFQGYLDEFRVSKGVARWTADFDAPTEAYDSTVQSNEVTIAGGVGFSGSLDIVGDSESFQAQGMIGIGGTIDVTNSPNSTIVGGIGYGGYIRAERVIPSLVDLAGGIGFGGTVSLTNENIISIGGGIGIGGSVDLLGTLPIAMTCAIGFGGSLTIEPQPLVNILGNIGFGGILSMENRSNIDISGGIAVGGGVSFGQVSFGQDYADALPDNSARWC